MRVLVISNLFLPDHAGGSAIYSDLCVELAARGHDVTVRCAYPYFPEWTDKSGDNGWAVSTSQSRGVTVERHGLFIPRNTRSLLQRLMYELSFLGSLTRRLWRGPRPDVVLAFSTMLSPVAFGVLVKRIRRVPLMINVQDFTSGGATASELISGRLSKVLASVERRLLSSATEFATISPEMVTSLETMTRGKVPVLYAPNWLNESLATAVATLPTKVGRAAHDPIDLLYAGNIGNKQDLIEFCQHVQHSSLNVTVSVHGSGPGADELRTWMESHADERFSMGPFLNERAFIERLYQCDLFVITERSGSGASYMPSKLIPAIATATPVLAVCDDESSLGQEMKRSGLGPHLTWDQLHTLDDVLASAADADVYTTWQHSAEARSKSFERERIIDDLEQHLVELADRTR